MVDANLARRSVQHSRAACRSIIWEIWALSVDDREVDSVVVDEGETDELASEVRIGLSAGGRWIRTIGPCREGAGLYEPSQDLAPLVSSWQLGSEPDENIGRPGAPGAPGMDVAQVTTRSGLRWRLR